MNGVDNILRDISSTDRVESKLNKMKIRIEEEGYLGSTWLSGLLKREPKIISFIGITHQLRYTFGEVYSMG